MRPEEEKNNTRENILSIARLLSGQEMQTSLAYLELTTCLAELGFQFATCVAALGQTKHI